MTETNCTCEPGHHLSPDTFLCVKGEQTATFCCIVHTASIVCGWVYVTVPCPSVCLSVRLSVPSIDRCRRCGGFAAVGPSGKRYRSIAARPAPQQQMRAVPCLLLTQEAERRLAYTDTGLTMLLKTCGG